MAQPARATKEGLMIDDTDTATDTGDVVVTVRIAAPPEAVFDHLIEPEKLMAWMGVDADIEPRPGGRFRLNVTGKDVAVGSYVAVDPPRTVSFTWGWSTAPTSHRDRPRWPSIWRPTGTTRW